MYSFLEVVVLCVFFTVYWANREKRKYLKQRIGAKALLNVYQTGRNFSFMLKSGDLDIMGGTNRLHNGGVLYSFHFGVWELMPAALRKLGYNLGIIVNRYHDQKRIFLTNLADQFLYDFRSRNSVRVFYKEDTMKIVNFIKSGGLLGMLVDGDTFYAKFEKAQKLARLCNVPLIPFAAYRKNGTGILDIGCNLDGLVEQRPLDYLWSYQSR